MEIATAPSSPAHEFRFDSALLDDAYHADSSPTMNPFAFGSADDVNPFLSTALTAPSSPNPFGLLPPDGTAGGDPFDLFQHFASAPASPARAAAIYAQFSSVHDDGADRDNGEEDDDQDDDVFQPRSSYSTRTVPSAVPFDWEERPGMPKHAYAASATATGEDADFDFGVLLDRSAQKAPELTTADELFDEGKIRPLKPPPRLLDSSSVGSSPRSARSAMWSPRLRGLGGHGPGPNFDPFAAAMANASSAPALSPLGAGAKVAAIDAGTDTVLMNPDSVASPRSVPPPTASNGGGRKKWRLTDLLLFRRLSAKGRATATGNISREPVFKYAPVQHLGPPVKKTEAVAAANGDASSAAGKQKKQRKHAATMGAGSGGGGGGMSAARLMGCVRLNPGLHRLAKGLNVPTTSHFGRRNAGAAMHG